MRRCAIVVNNKEVRLFACLFVCLFVFLSTSTRHNTQRMFDLNTVSGMAVAYPTFERVQIDSCDNDRHLDTVTLPFSKCVVVFTRNMYL